MEFFLVERYWLFTADNGTLFRGRVHHEPWQLRSATLESFASTLVKRAGLPAPVGNPMLLATQPVRSQIWPLEEV